MKIKLDEDEIICAIRDYLNVRTDWKHKIKDCIFNFNSEGEVEVEIDVE